MPMRSALPKTWLAALGCAVALAGCGKKEEPANNLAALDRQLVANNADPAVTSALNDQILVDSNLATQSNRNAARPAPTPAGAPYPAADGAPPNSRRG